MHNIVKSLIWILLCELKLLFFYLTHQKKITWYMPTQILSQCISCFKCKDISAASTLFCTLVFAVSKGKRAIKEDTKKVICSSSSNVLDYRDRVWAKIFLILVRYIGNWWHLLSSPIFLWLWYTRSDFSQRAKGTKMLGYCDPMCTCSVLIHTFERAT